MQPLSIRRAYTGRKVLLTGATGFLGKVWLVMMLDRCPGIGKIYVLLRRKALLSARDRFEKMIATSPAFAPLHERHGEALGEYIARRVEIIEGDVSLPGLGLDEAVAKDVRGGLDLVIHCAGLVDFDPDIREAVSINVDGTAHMADFVEGCARARLLHVSTCYVTGTRPGTIAETLLPGFSPEGPPLDIEADVTGVVVEILVDNGKAVQFGQPLMKIRPA